MQFTEASSLSPSCGAALTSRTGPAAETLDEWLRGELPRRFEGRIAHIDGAGIR